MHRRGRPPEIRGSGAGDESSCIGCELHEEDASVGPHVLEVSEASVSQQQWQWMAAVMYTDSCIIPCLAIIVTPDPQLVGPSSPGRQTPLRPGP